MTNNMLFSEDEISRFSRELIFEKSTGIELFSAKQLNFCLIELKLARHLNKLWHSRLPQTSEANLIRSKDKINFGMYHGNLWYAVAIWTSPISRALNNKNYLELRRLSIAPESPKYTASRFISIMTKEIRRRLPHIVKLISYQDTEVHTGTIYKASGWYIGRIMKDNECRWGLGNRKRKRPQTRVPKIRWE